MITKKELDEMKLEVVKNYYEGLRDQYGKIAGDNFYRSPYYQDYCSERDMVKDYIQERRVKEGQVSDLEKQFREVYHDTVKQMNEKLEKAQKYLREAVALSEETGVPLEASVSPLFQIYWPESGEKFSEIEELVEDFQLQGNDGYWGGWEHSAVC